MIIGIEWISKPTKKEYKIGDPLNLSGAYINMVYSDGSKVPIGVLMSYIQGYDSSKENDELIVYVNVYDSLTNKVFQLDFSVRIINPLND